MSEEQAKQILDFLAKKAGGLEIVFSDQYAYLKILDPDKKLFSGQNIQYYKEMLCGNKNGHYASILESTNNRALSRMLELTSIDYDIKCGNFKDTRMFLRRGTTLEQINIEMELQEIS